ncbi:glycosyltransferase family 4 protein [Nostocaceae cyanobacterium CENA357]|uniref:Glycosyltransferase family 4 protein n=1 Tax=Atlanticothrix silvestris CENA357 TaxID=1725252 RepID=A0A8J7H9T1_9CYAN|nr:glycosyltransferase family 4 protein [Atlanticothrix silvestris]MBH8552207.1 glycosyltransferase family 4 protein [Atlanticothrix silvestris CENA357]
MKILHIGASVSPEAVNGINYVVWSVARSQVILGHNVSILLNGKPINSTIDFAEKTGINLLYIPSKNGMYNKKALDNLLKSDTAEIFHFHSIFLFRQASLSAHLVRQKIPYIVTPHAITPEFLRRGWLKKWLYGWLIEKPRLLKASAITAVTPGEQRTIQDYVPNYKGVIYCITNPVKIEDFSDTTWSGNINSKKLVYLGRFDVFHKGIDILVELASLLTPDIEVHLYGRTDTKTSNWLKRIQANLPANIYFHPPVFKAEKNKVLTQASMYIQTSRWEVFGVSIAEAMYLGLPCAIMPTMNLAEIFQEHDLGLVLPTKLEEAAKLLIHTLNQPDVLHHWSKKAHLYAKENFQPQKIAIEYLRVYEEVLH